MNNKWVCLSVDDETIYAQIGLPKKPKYKEPEKIAFEIKGEMDHEAKLVGLANVENLVKQYGVEHPTKLEESVYTYQTNSVKEKQRWEKRNFGEEIANGTHQQETERKEGATEDHFVCSVGKPLSEFHCNCSEGDEVDLDDDKTDYVQKRDPIIATRFNARLRGVDYEEELEMEKAKPTKNPHPHTGNYCFDCF